VTETKRQIEATCPDCRGPLSVVRLDQDTPEYRCLVGHRYSALALLQAHSEAQEKALWAAVVSLEEATPIVENIEGQFAHEVAERLKGQAARKRELAIKIRRVLERLDPFQVD
jgi:two-component system chemotaxis response regulator CheB